ncbi:MAG: hypothetical protein WAO21_01745 [Verrucomicrobiia bacterium]
MKTNFNAPDTGDKNVVPPSNAAASALQISPAFTTRFPRPGQREPFSGLCRSQLFSLIKSGKVKSYSLKMPGCSRGVRLIDCASLRAAIESFGDSQQEGVAI